VVVLVAYLAKFVVAFFALSSVATLRYMGILFWVSLDERAGELLSMIYTIRILACVSVTKCFFDL